MSTLIRPEITTKSEYYLPKHRFYELKHFVMQYPLWKKDPERYSRQIELVKRCAQETDEIIGPLIFEAVVNDWSYELIRARKNVPCCKDTYYHLYRRFFWTINTFKSL